MNQNGIEKIKRSISIIEDDCKQKVSQLKQNMLDLIREQYDIVYGLSECRISGFDCSTKLLTFYFDYNEALKVSEKYKGTIVTVVKVTSLSGEEILCLDSKRNNYKKS